MKKTMLLLLLFCLSFCGAVSADTAEDQLAVKMNEFDLVMAEIRRLPGQIDEDLCSGDQASYRRHMTELAQNIISANTIIKDVKLYYPIDLWTVYNRISRNPVCGAGAIAAESAFGVADYSRIANEEKMGVRDNEDLCLCWNIATGREELTGFYKDGACRCTFGIRNLDPNIGRN